MGPGHFQSMKHPEIRAPANRYSLEDSSDNEDAMKEVSDNEEEEVEQIQESISCDECDKSFNNIKRLTLHIMRHDKLQCVFCHKESPNEAEFIIHEKVHQDTEKNYACDLCEKKYKSSSDARLHEYCHNRYEILKQMKKIQINLYNQMMDISPEIIRQTKNEFILKQQNDRKIRIRQEESLKKATKEVKKTRKEKHLNKSEEILNAEKKEIDQAIKEPQKEAKEEDIKTEKKKK